MKKMIMALITVIVLTGCSAKEAKVREEKAQEVTAAETTVATEAETSAETSTVQKTTVQKTTAKVTTTKTEATQTTSVSETTQVQTNAAQQTTASAAPIKHYTVDGFEGPEEIPEAEWNALTKLKEKYGSTFEVITRSLCWEFWPKTILNDDGTRTTIPINRDPNEPLDVVYTLKGSDGVYFEARIKDKTDIITHDTYIYDHYKESLHNEAAGSLQKLVPGGKVYFNGGDNGELPFECPADMTYEEFRQAMADNGRYVFGTVYVTDGMDVSDEMKLYSPRRGDGHPGEYGYFLMVHVSKISQEDYDRLDDVFTDYPGQMESELLN